MRDAPGHIILCIGLTASSCTIATFNQRTSAGGGVGCIPTTADRDLGGQKTGFCDFILIKGSFLNCLGAHIINWGPKKIIRGPTNFTVPVALKLRFNHWNYESLFVGFLITLIIIIVLNNHNGTATH